ncbi:MAG: hypothetical protein IJV06_07840 [Bacteroidaceae bacterium]|nr:hypothetical protein [Bacteroidaceae bacterium]
MTFKPYNRIFFLLLLAVLPIASIAQSLESAFLNPPAEARALMIWQWMDGVVSREGITADLEAYKEAGLGGVQQFHVGGEMQGLICDTTQAIGTENWQRLMRFALQECQRLGLSFGTHNCPGWSSSAYPAVRPEDSMQKLVWTETKAQGGKWQLKLPRPDVDARWDYYKDVVVLAIPDRDSVALSEVVDLTSQIAQDGLLNWTAPQGAWRIYRFGHTTNGKTNVATSPYGGMGLECDKMSREAVKKYWQSYPAMLFGLAQAALGNAWTQTFQRIEIDSYEAGTQDWTAQMPAEFLSRRHYNLLPWLLTFAGCTVENGARSKQFKKDFIDTATDLFAENYYGYMGTLCREQGLQLLAQPYGTGSSKQFNPINTDKIVRQKSIDLVCAEFWTHPNWGWKDVPRVVAAARRNNHRLIYAEGFTCWPLFAWQDDPASLKEVANRAFCQGINRLMLHAGAHNPWPQALPGMTFGKWGTQFTPGQTWWRSGGAKLLFEYFARCQALLQRGDYVDDTNSKQKSLTTDVPLQWIHRKEADTDFYFVANPLDSSFVTTLTFAGAGRLPELWNPVTGTLTAAQYWLSADGKTQVALPFDTHESVFVVFRKNTSSTGTTLALKPAETLDETLIAGSWTVNFPEGWGAPTETTFPALLSWDKHEDAGIKYFSGTARYTAAFRMKRIDKQARYVLDLGAVKNLARVFLNGVEVAHLWAPPFRVDVTEALRKGKNLLAVEVTNLWPNRMIGDEQYPDDTEWGEMYKYDYAPGKPNIGRFMKAIPDWLSKGQPRPSQDRKTVVSFKFFEKDTPLLPSGLLGPVIIKRVRE